MIIRKNKNVNGEIVKKEVSIKISLYSFFMTCCIVLYHAHIGEPTAYLNLLDEKMYIFFTNLIDGLGHMAMGYFFTTTGFLTYYNLNENNIKKKLIRRIRSLLVPYTIWNFLYYLYYLIIKREVFAYSVKEFLIKMVFRPFDGATWYLLVVFVLALFSPFFLKILKNRKLSKKIYILLVVGSFCCTVYFADLVYKIPYGFYFERIIRYMPNYFFGALIGMNFFMNIGKEEGKSNVIAKILFVITLVIIGWGNIDTALKWWIQRIQPISLWFVTSSKSEIYKKELAGVCGSFFIIYVMHGLELEVLNAMISRLLTLSFFGCGIIITRILLMIIVVVWSYGIWKLLNRFAPKSLKILTGGR